MMRVAVTGSTGFIGKNLVASLKKNKYEVVEISRSKRFDICQWESVKNINACDVIVHLAAKTFVPDSFDNPREFYEVNTKATINALELSRLWKARFIYMSSYFYGAPQYVPVDEKHPINPHNPYAQSKLISEEMCRGYHRDFDVPITAFRLFNIYGPDQNDSFLIPEILKQIASGKVILKDPRPKRDYIHVADVVSAIVKTIEVQLKGFNIFNLGTGKSCSVESLINELMKVSPYKFEVEFTHEYRKGEVLDSVADTSKLKNAIEWENEIDITEGLKSFFL